MNGKRFLDTNILLYGISTVPEEETKREAALKLIRRGHFCLSTQVLGEFYTNATRPKKANPPIPHEEVIEMIQRMNFLEVQAITPKIFWDALAIREVFGITYWDAQIVAAARAMDCGVIESEDMADGQDYAGVRVHNPFGEIG